MAFIGVGSRSGSLLSYKHDLPWEGCTIFTVSPKGRPCLSSAVREAHVGVFCQQCSGSTAEIRALGWYVLCLRHIILGNFYRVASQMSWLWIKPLLIYVCSKEKYSIAKTKMVLSIITFLCVLWMRLSLYNNNK